MSSKFHASALPLTLIADRPRWFSRCTRSRPLVWCIMRAVPPFFEQYLTAGSRADLIASATTEAGWRRPAFEHLCRGGERRAVRAREEGARDFVRRSRRSHPGHLPPRTRCFVKRSGARARQQAGLPPGSHIDVGHPGFSRDVQRRLPVDGRRVGRSDHPGAVRGHPQPDDASPFTSYGRRSERIAADAVNQARAFVRGRRGRIPAPFQHRRSALPKSTARRRRCATPSRRR